MVALLIILFALLMLSSAPMAIVLGLTSTLSITLLTKVPLRVIPQQLFTAVDSSALMAVPFFILAGQLMTSGKIADRLIKVASALTSSLRGGLAISAVLACAFFAAISGSSPATVVAVGSMMIPALTERGYHKNFSTGLLTTAGSLGIMIPPSIPMIIYALIMNVSVTKEFLAGIVPGLLISGLFIAYSSFQAKKHRWDSTEVFSLRAVAASIKRGFWGLLLPILVLGGIYGGIFTTTEAAAVSVVYALCCELLIYKGLKLKQLPAILKDAALLSAVLLFIVANASCLSWFLASQQVPSKVAVAIGEFVTTRWMFLLLVNVLFLGLGMLMDIVSAMIIIAPILYPMLQKFDIDLIHFGIIMIVNIEIGFLSPPFGLNLFVASGITKRPVLEVTRSVLPFLLLMILVLLLLALLPSISLFLPNLLVK
ncbi:C4-dicarboxylate ABC transporter permease [candidate division KSB3 bacterium]|uniref:C4-dicarboxylate ABC transporter permease n=1 Tax=candidate division KSB3 bacterium TaxID=2044937 RepID=A0A2G6E316_9BACT|nr:MAG: C4-dicarboxylate ABC transporter permease [candidate division KSB3 bacterium]PIE28759.1 MAG: C4-dicarboxylate ABC transporter permease [candidate division KSB3 bacterium]